MQTIESYTCRECNISKPLSSDNFKPERRTKHGWDTVCRQCRRDQRNQRRRENHAAALAKEAAYRQTEAYKDYHTQYQEENRERLLETARERYNTNPEPYLRRSKEQKARDPEGYKAYLKQWRNDNRHYLNEKQKLRLKTDIHFKLRQKISGSLRKAIKLQGGHKQGSILKYIGCSIDCLKGYIEGQFKDGMTWENHGTVWHIDHKIPTRAFNLLNESDIYKCYHYSNLQPLFAADNCSKQDKMPDGSFARNIAIDKIA